MPFKIFIATLLLSLLTFSTVNGQIIDTTQETIKTYQTDSTTVANSDNMEADDDFAPGILFFALIGIGLVFICVGIGVVIAATGLFFVFGLVGLGILSTSAIVGLNKKSFSKGFKTFLLLSTGVGGLCICTTASYLINRLVNLHFAVNVTLLIGAASGLIGGVLLGQAIYIILRRLTNYFIQRLNIA